MAELFKNAIQNTPVKAKTFNGGATFESSTNPCVDLFFIIGASRGKNIISTFEKSLGFDEDTTLRMLFWARDIRQGAGERKTFRDLFLHLEKNRPSTALKLLRLVPEYGRWDDLLIFTGSLQKPAFEVIANGLKNPATSGLCAKWMPRKGYLAKQLREHLGLSPKAYRKLLVSLSKDVVEVKMCAKEWNAIDFNKVPSLASARYQKAFFKNAPETYSAYRSALSSKDPVVRSTAKINASAIFPHDVLKSVYRGDPEVAKAQWDALPNYLGDNKILPVCDVSGSMGTFGLTAKGNVAPIDISVSLGLYIADKQTGPFKDLVCTFSGESRFEVLKGDILSKTKQLSNLHWSMNTNLEKVFANILKLAVQHSLPDSELPRIVLIISDMEFDSCVSNKEKTVYQKAKQEFEKRGYTLPKVVFWNVNGRAGNSPVTVKDENTALVSGYSPSILKSVLKADFAEFTPVGIMNSTLKAARYNPVTEALKA